jgi:hypothetical protein
MLKSSREGTTSTVKLANTLAEVELEWEVVHGPAPRAVQHGEQLQPVGGRGLHSPTFQLNLSASYGIGGAPRGCVTLVKGVLGCVGCFLVSDTAGVELRSERV